MSKPIILDGYRLTNWTPIVQRCWFRKWQKDSAIHDAITVRGRAPNVRWTAMLPDGTQRTATAAKVADAKERADAWIREQVAARGTAGKDP